MDGVLESINSLGFWCKKLSQVFPSLVRSTLVWKIIHEISIPSYLLFLRKWNSQTQVRLQHQGLPEYRQAQSFPKHQPIPDAAGAMAKLISDKLKFELWALTPSS